MFSEFSLIAKPFFGLEFLIGRYFYSTYKKDLKNLYLSAEPRFYTLINNTVSFNFEVILYLFVKNIFKYLFHF